MKKVVCLLMAIAMVFSFAACKKEEKNSSTPQGSQTGNSSVVKGVANDDLKVGFIYIGDENEGYTAAHYYGAKAMQEALGLKDDQLIFKWNTPEDETCYDAAVDLAEQGCNIIFANSFNFEPFIIQAAKEYPEIQFCHATGYQAKSSGLANMHNYFTSVYESRYVSGVVAGMKLNEMIEEGKITADQAVIGYVGAFPFAEVISGYTSFYLGARSVCPSVTMKVTYVNNWSSFDLEKEAAEALIADGCVLISQHSDTTGPATACEAKGVPMVGYNISMTSVAPNQALTSASIDWAPYVTYATKCVLEGEEIVVDWCKGYADGADKITELNEKVIAAGTADKVAEVEAAIKNGTLHVFDTTTWTVDGAHLDSYKDDFGNEYISDGYFHESELASAPAFNIIIDGVTATK